MRFLYHGSSVSGLTILEPRRRYTPGTHVEASAVYATPLPSVAAIHGFGWSSDEGFDFQLIGDSITLTVPEGLKDRLARPMSIYKLPSSNFKLSTEEVTGTTWISDVPVKVLNETLYPSVESALCATGVAIVFVK